MGGHYQWWFAVGAGTMGAFHPTKSSNFPWVIWQITSMMYSVVIISIMMAWNFLILEFSAGFAVSPLTPSPLLPSALSHIPYYIQRELTGSVWCLASFTTLKAWDSFLFWHRSVIYSFITQDRIFPTAWLGSSLFVCCPVNRHWRQLRFELSGMNELLAFSLLHVFPKVFAFIFSWTHNCRWYDRILWQATYIVVIMSAFRESYQPCHMLAGTENDQSL